MINALMTGLGIGLAFWIVVIPTALLIARKKNEETIEDNKATNKRSLELLEQRNETDEQIKVALWNICEALLRDKK